jgi:UDP-N-acetylmuramyl pentapeptide phosphotransferase/UDP-N-acetylglucosamine-1-phosphate transferase
MGGTAVVAATVAIVVVGDVGTAVVVAATVATLAASVAVTIADDIACVGMDAEPNGRAHRITVAIIATVGFCLHGGWRRLEHSEPAWEQR